MSTASSPLTRDQRRAKRRALEKINRGLVTFDAGRQELLTLLDERRALLRGAGDLDDDWLAAYSFQLKFQSATFEGVKKITECLQPSKIEAALPEDVS